MQIFNSSEEIANAIETCKDKEEASKALRAVIALAVHDKKKMNPSDYPKDTLTGHVLMSTLLLAVRNM